MPSGSQINFAGNAWLGRGGQGEFLRGMIEVLSAVPESRVFSRSANSPSVGCVNLPPRGWRGGLSRAIRGIPALRGRRDWIQLLSDTDFDQQLSLAVTPGGLLDAVMGQCCA
ncbi:MAG: hypothetical protein ACREJC_02700, partial [Tepidisphaeraceae bacterium]